MRPRDFNARGDKCPICGKGFRSDACPHSVEEAEDHLEEQLVRSIVRDEIAALTATRDREWIAALRGPLQGDEHIEAVIAQLTGGEP